ncbi:hypothetical protein BpHYR1_013574 [Brachionus plicatilis]|uniref:Uncharacterized protein n=1 Tax=Brachionus plicatilis TaxID=10195 RepID=A0A3M7QAW4_BRAPC|nr:hypothetical protein BpHYR1_013574 [Brachionus plicatilis]
MEHFGHKSNCRWFVRVLFGEVGAYPKMTAFQSIMLLSVGAPLTPTGGSSWSLLKSRISLRLAVIFNFDKFRTKYPSDEEAL